MPNELDLFASRDPFGYKRECSTEGCTNTFMYDHEQSEDKCVDCGAKQFREEWEQFVLQCARECTNCSQLQANYDGLSICNDCAIKHDVV